MDLRSKQSFLSLTSVTFRQSRADVFQEFVVTSDPINVDHARHDFF